MVGLFIVRAIVGCCLTFICSLGLSMVTHASSYVALRMDSRSSLAISNLPDFWRLKDRLGIIARDSL